MVAVLRPLGLLLPRAWAGIQGPRGQRLPEEGEGEGGAEPKERADGRAGGPISSGASPLFWGLQHLALPHSRLLVPLQAHHCDTGAREGVRQGQDPPGAWLTPTHLARPWTPTSLLCPFGPPAAEPVCPSRWSGCESSSKSSNTSPGWGSACQAAGGATPEAGATRESGPRAGSSERRG